jgi:outer membrane receptor protein involved in Fe transport
MLTGAGAAFAQEADATRVEELVVTAQKREENLQRVPFSIQALSTTKLEELQVNDFDDFAKFLPSVSYKTFGPGFTSIYMRGVASGENSNHSGPLPSVGVYLDEQPVTTITGPLDIHIYDIARVEALAGPQGTLYGASSQAGTIRIITNKPDSTGFSASYDLEVNSVAHGDLGYVAEGHLNAPMGDRAAVRLVGWYDRDGGYIDNVLGSRLYPTCNCTDTNTAFAEDDYNDVETYGGRAALRFDLNENWTVTPSLMAQNTYANGIFAFDPNVGDLAVTHFRPEYSDDRWYQAALTVEGKIAGFDVTYAGAYMKRDVDGANDYSDYSYYYDTLYGYGSYWYDDAGDPVQPTQYIQYKDRYKKQSHELRFASPREHRLRVVAGLFYLRQDHLIEQNYKIDNIATAIEVNGFPDTIWLTKQRRRDEDWAAFGEASFDILENLTFTGGIRAFKSRNSLHGFFGFGDGYSGSTGVSQCFAPASVPGSPCTNLDKEVEETGYTHKLNLQWQVTEDKMVYATWSTGYRPGGINRRGDINYLSDFLTNYEAGFKTTWLDGRLRINGAVFYDQWEDFQFSFLGINGLTVIRNAAAAEMKGAELEVNWRPTEGLTIFGSAAYVDATLTEDYCGTTLPDGSPETDCANPQAPAGSELPITPKFKGNITARYDFPMGDFDANVQASLVYTGSTWSDLRTEAPVPPEPDLVVPIRSNLGRNDAFATVDLSAGLERGNWRVEVFAKNLLDERGEIGRYTECVIQVCAQTLDFQSVYIIPTRPRTIGIRFGQDF